MDKTVPGVTPVLYSLPAPRGRILDRNGHALATSRERHIITYAIGDAAAKDPAAVLAALQSLTDDLGDALTLPTAADIESHCTYRARIPLEISSPLGADQVREILSQAGNERLGTKTIQLRYYPEGKTAAHILGHLQATGAPLSGAVRQKEPYWRRMTGAAGIEKSYDSALTGSDGLMVVAHDSSGRALESEVLTEPVPGKDVVLSIDLALQQRCEAELAKTGRPGSGVVLDAEEGGILAMASYPLFDPNSFVPSISTAEYAALTQDPNAPLFHRAAHAAYPPGSVFKPITALAALDTFAIRSNQLLRCPPALDIDGRDFKNWTTEDDGRFDLRGAMVRSNNPYFYQIGIRTRDRAILRVARDFGYGEEIPLPLEGGVAGALPAKAPSRQGLANLAIGQGEVLATNLQVASMMSGFARVYYRPLPRLVRQVQTPGGQIVQTFPTRSAAHLRYQRRDLRAIRGSLFSVVNHERGTAGRARLASTQLCGKTGTAQWVKDGRDAQIAWFAGLLPATTPAVSFCFVQEGSPDVSLSGGRHAAPLAKSVLGSILSGDSSTLALSGQNRRPRTESDRLLAPDVEEILDAPVAQPVNIYDPYNR